jgi:hypothetical protein
MTKRGAGMYSEGFRSGALRLAEPGQTLTQLAREPSIPTVMDRARVELGLEGM